MKWCYWEKKQTLLDQDKLLRLNVKLPKNFLAEAVNTACFIINRSPSFTINFMIFEVVWSNKPIDLSKLRIFSSLHMIMHRV